MSVGLSDYGNGRKDRTCEIGSGSWEQTGLGRTHSGNQRKDLQKNSIGNRKQ